MVNQILILKHTNNISLGIFICKSQHHFIPFLSTLDYRYPQLGYWYAFSKQTAGYIYRIIDILHVVYSSLRVHMDIKDLQNNMVLKICKYKKRTRTKV